MRPASARSCWSAWASVTDPVDIVRSGYDALSYRYRADDSDEGRYAAWIDTIRTHCAPGGAVLDAGCGCGVPVSRSLARAGCEVVGVDLSDVQIERARRLVPAATFIRADLTEVAFEAGSFDAIACFNALIHVPLDRQATLLTRMANWLRPGGLLLMTAGHRAWTGRDEAWLGGGVPMWWSHADAGTYRAWLQAAGLRIVAEDFVSEGDGGHAFFSASRGESPACLPA
jgi:2-polyprenyl-3-methyl-5-hydroxy-6-metoxy-1,4-benzoquinol methylase